MIGISLMASPPRDREYHSLPLLRSGSAFFILTLAAWIYKKQRHHNFVPPIALMIPFYFEFLFGGSLGDPRKICHSGYLTSPSLLFYRYEKSPSRPYTGQCWGNTPSVSNKIHDVLNMQCIQKSVKNGTQNVSSLKYVRICVGDNKEFFKKDGAAPVYAIQFRKRVCYVFETNY